MLDWCSEWENTVGRQDGAVGCEHDIVSREFLDGVQLVITVMDMHTKSFASLTGRPLLDFTLPLPQQRFWSDNQSRLQCH